jgi:outer membrane protein assembly factor BamB
LNWKYAIESIVTSSATHNGIVYIESYDHNVYALNATTRAKVWNYTTGDWVLSSPTVADGIG